VDIGAALGFWRRRQKPLAPAGNQTSNCPAHGPRLCYPGSPENTTSNCDETNSTKSTDSMEQSLSWEATGPELNKKFPALYGTPRWFITAFKLPITHPYLKPKESVRGVGRCFVLLLSFCVEEFVSTSLNPEVGGRPLFDFATAYSIYSHIPSISRSCSSIHHLRMCRAGVTGTHLSQPWILLLIIKLLFCKYWSR
jgi:hypothetical protein